MSDYGRQIAANVRAERARRRLTSEQLAQLMRERGLTWWRRQTVGSIEHERRQVTAVEICHLADILETNASQLLGR